jgi:hypothetical protein
LHYLSSVFGHLGLQNTLQRRPFNDFFFKKQLCQLLERIPAGGQQRRTFWCASVKTRVISSSTLRAVSSLYSLEEGPPDLSANYLLADYDVCNQSLPCERPELAVSDRFDARRGEKAL